MIDRSSDESHYSITRHTVHPSYGIISHRIAVIYLPYCRGRGMNVVNIYPSIYIYLL